jgi:hypothetical protein
LRLMRYDTSNLNLDSVTQLERLYSTIVDELQCKLSSRT